MDWIFTILSSVLIQCLRFLYKDQYSNRGHREYEFYFSCEILIVILGSLKRPYFMFIDIKDYIS